jgi:hypothetical protein
MIDSAARWLQRAWILIGWIGISAVIVLSLIPSPPQLLRVEQGDKVEHMLAFGSLMFWFAQVYVQRRRRLMTAGLLAALGIAIEFAQGDTGYRTFEYADMGADCAGTIVGWLLAPPRVPNLYAWSERVLLAPKPPLDPSARLLLPSGCNGSRPLLSVDGAGRHCYIDAPETAPPPAH